MLLGFLQAFPSILNKSLNYFFKVHLVMQVCLVWHSGVWSCDTRLCVLEETLIWHLPDECARGWHRLSLLYLQASNFLIFKKRSRILSFCARSLSFVFSTIHPCFGKIVFGSWGLLRPGVRFQPSRQLRLEVASLPLFTLLIGPQSFFLFSPLKVKEKLGW